MSEPLQSKPVETVTLTIDGRSVTVPKGTTILTAAEQLGTRVPHYCYHAGLSAPAMCRLCLVEVEKAPKLQPACVTTVAEGQVVHTQSDKSLSMRQGVLEFYLQNHPLDCPICDQSGECKLQDYAHAEGRFHGRGKEPKRVFGRDDFGGDVLFYGDRCVMCTRCVRFMNEVEQDPRLTVVERGDRSIIDTFFDEGLEGTHFHGNIVDICPVGALLSKDFLFKQRAWDLDHTPSVCPSCSQGCNVELHTRDNLVQRIRPRLNLDVNAHWMCDYGRLSYEWINRGDRIEVPLVRAEQGVRATGWREALAAVLDRVDAGPVKAVVSARLSNEDLGAVRALVDQLGGGEIVYRSERAPDEVPLKGFPKLVRRRDLAPNVNGAQLLGMKRVGADDATGGLDGFAGHGGVILVVGDDLADQPESFGESAALYVFMGTHPSAAAAHAHFVLPLTTFAEQEGTFTNHENRVQRFWPALEAPGAARPAWLVLGAMLADRTGGEPPTRPETAFEAIRAFGGLTYQQVGTRGARVGGARAETAGAAGD
jgi:NADH-quinone oxidoreductase subunit G